MSGKQVSVQGWMGVLMVMGLWLIFIHVYFVFRSLKTTNWMFVDLWCHCLATISRM
jgi:hypothetical protein